MPVVRPADQHIERIDYFNKDQPNLECWLTESEPGPSLISSPTLTTIDDSTGIGRRPQTSGPIFRASQLRIRTQDDAMTVLRPITDDEFSAWLEAEVPAYAADKVANGQWSQDTALELARKDFTDLLPQGRSTEGQHLYTVLDASGAAVGTLWFGVKDRGGQRIAYVYDVVVAPGHRRRGHAERAFKALEQEAARLGLAGIALHVFGHNLAAQALYARLGFAPTNINLYKPLKAQGS